jgi:hypothetical protein
MSKLIDSDFIQHMRQSLTSVKRTGYEEIASLYEHIVNEYESLASQGITQFSERIHAMAALEAVSYILPYPIRKKIGLEHHVCERPDLAMEIARNMLRLLAVPESHIDKLSRKEYLQAAKHGEDVYAYYHPASQIWNLYHTDTRILLCPLVKRWTILTTQREPSGYWWQVTLSPPGSEDTYTRRIEVTPLVQDTDRVYPERAQRVILNAVNHCCAFGINPCQLDDTHH